MTEIKYILDSLLEIPQESNGEERKDKTEFLTKILDEHFKLGKLGVLLET